MKNDLEEYLTVAELSKRIKFSRQTIYNMISTKRFVKGLYYVKPSRKKVLFTWSSTRAWLEDHNTSADQQDTASGERSPMGNRIHI
jgi:predicted DNA-binding transcriptional regulator AlpA